MFLYSRDKQNEVSVVKNIKIVSPAKSIDLSIVEKAVKLLSDRGYKLSVSDKAIGTHNYFSATDKDRLDDFQQALDDPEVDVILCARGGYGSVRIIDRLDFTKFELRPKLILGYSDITVFHNRMNNMGYVSGHTTAPLNFTENTPEALESLYCLIEGKKNRYEISADPLNKKGQVNAPVVGGNLSIITSLVGTNDDINMEGKILFVEEVGEAIYAIDRMFYTLEKAGKLKGLAGLIIGGMSGLKDSAVPFGQTVEEVIAAHVERFGYPVCFNFPAGHIDDNRAILLNAVALLDVQDTKVIFEQTQP